jgi:hypothetical protein
VKWVTAFFFRAQRHWIDVTHPGSQLRYGGLLSNDRSPQAETAFLAATRSAPGANAWAAQLGEPAKEVAAPAAK